MLNLLGRLSSVLSGGVIGILLARRFGAETYGTWSAAVVYGALVLTAIEGGLDRVLIREASRQPEQTGVILRAVLRGRVVIASVVIPTALIAAWLIDPTLSSWLLVLFLVLARFAEGLQSSYFAALYARHRFGPPNLIETGRRVVVFGGVVVLLLFDGPILGAAIISFGVVLVSTYFVRAATAREGIHTEAGQGLRHLRVDAFWFWLGGLLFWINGEVDQLMLTGMLGAEATGIYAAAMRLVIFFFIIPVAVNNTIIPRLFRSARSGKNLSLHLNGSALMLTVVGGIIALETYLGREAIVEILYGEAFLKSGPILGILSAYVFIDFMRMAPSWYIAAADRVALNTTFLLVAALQNVLLNVWLIPKIGPAGAAWATVASSVTLLVLVSGVTSFLTSPRFLLSFVVGAVPVALAALLHTQIIGTLGYWGGAAVTVTVIGAGLLASFMHLRRSGPPAWLFGPRDASDAE
ncbi:MAG: flippase [Deltaproteobacteria bacterium]|nr:flippase [Deltaproteobacteria bacterium]